MTVFDSAALIDTTLDCRSISFENPHGERGAGGTAAAGRKGSPDRLIRPGEKLVLADIRGPGRIRHIWMNAPLGAPEQMRAIWMEAYYDDASSPSISVPCLDFFGLPHGRLAAYDSALTSVHEGRGLNAYFPMPFQKRFRLELTNSGGRAIDFYYQIDYTLEPMNPLEGYLHVLFNRENPTKLKRDFVIASNLRGPGRFLGSAVGIRVLQDGMLWYGEGEFKVYRDGDDILPTTCGTGLEDYVGSAWGMRQHTSFYSGVPVYVAAQEASNSSHSIQAALKARMPDFVSFYRWHLADPIVFRESLRATIQQIGAVADIGPTAGTIQRKYTVAGRGWATSATEAGKQMLEWMDPEMRRGVGTEFVMGIAERSDDYCAAAFVYCREPQAVPRLSISAATADIALRPYETVIAPF